MLSYAWNAIIEWMYEASQQIDEANVLCDKVMKVLEPYRFEKMGIYPYLFACSKKNLIYPQKAVSALAVMNISEFICKTEKDPGLYHAMNGTELFEIPVINQSTDFKQYQMDHNIRNVVNSAMKESGNHLRDAKKKLEPEIELIPPSIDEARKKLASPRLEEKIQAFLILNNVAKTCASFYHLKQQT